MRFLGVVVALAIKEFEQRRPKLTSRERPEDERLILRHVCIYLWKRHALCYAVFVYARNRWLNTLYGIVWETKYGWFSTPNIPKSENFTLLVCPLGFLVISAMRRLGNAQSFKTIHALPLSFLPWTLPRLGGLLHLETFTWQIVTPADRAALPGRPGDPPKRVSNLSCKRDQDKIRNYMDRRVTPPRRVTSPTLGPSPPHKQALKDWALIRRWTLIRGICDLS